MYLIITYLYDILWLEIWMAQFFLAQTSIVLTFKIWLVFRSVLFRSQSIKMCHTHLCKIFPFLFYSHFWQYFFWSFSSQVQLPGWWICLKRTPSSCAAPRHCTGANQAQLSPTTASSSTSTTATTSAKPSPTWHVKMPEKVCLTTTFIFVERVSAHRSFIVKMF